MPVFLFFWLVIFFIYLPTAHAGRVGDFPGWVATIHTQSFFDYINRRQFASHSFYQFTQIVTYLFYQVFGASAWPWHLLHVSLQAVNALLLFTFFRKLFTNAAVQNAALISFLGSLLFCLCPHISEVVVWEPAFHYLLGLLLMLIVLHCTQQFLITQKIRYVWGGGLVFFLSTYSLEVFYLTPIFTATLVTYYCTTLNYPKSLLKKALACFTSPQLFFFLVHSILLHLVYHENVAHIGSTTLLSAFNFSKSLKYIFHVLFFGRFFSDPVRNNVYHFCESGLGLCLFYGLLALVFVYIIARYHWFKNSSKAIALVLLWTALSFALLLPLWFPDSGLVVYDRYTYEPNAFFFIFLALLLHNTFRKPVFIAIIALYALVSIRFTHKVNAYWQQSAGIVNNLVATFPNDPSKKVLLLNLPECMDGVQMVGARDVEFKMMYNAIIPHKITNTVYDVEAFYMRGTSDGAHAKVINDSTVEVTLNQWATWWMYYDYGAYDYQTPDYKVLMKDMGHWYYLILKHPASEYLLLYNIGDQWRKVDFDKKNIEQY